MLSSDTKTVPLSSSPSLTTASSDVQHDSNFEKRTMRRVDRRVIPILGMLYALALIDRSNLGVARITGMGKDLNLAVGDRFSLVTMIYFFPYVLLQLPCNLLLRSFGAPRFLALLVLGWGTAQLGMGLTQTFFHLALCRLLLGGFESGFLPALIFVISTWYTRAETQKRIAGFYMFSLFFGGFSAILAFLLSRLDGKGGLAGWRWIFVIEGAITILFGILSWFYLPDFPDKNGFLNHAETMLVLQRVEDDRGDSLHDDLTCSKVLQHLKDWTIWVFALLLLCATIPAYANSFFIPIILSSMGWNVEQSLLLSAPPYIFATFTVFLFAWISDRIQQRALFIAIQTLITICGLILTGYCSGDRLRYFGLILSTSGSAGAIPGILTYASNNVFSHSKKAVSTAIQVSISGLGGIAAAALFRQQDAPRYMPGMITTISSQLLLLILLSVTSARFWLYNRQNSAREGYHGFLYTL